MGKITTCYKIYIKNYAMANSLYLVQRQFVAWLMEGHNLFTLFHAYIIPLLPYVVCTFHVCFYFDLFNFFFCYSDLYFFIQL